MGEQLIVETRAGKVRGAKQSNCEGDEFYAFRGVPYAKPPVGELRFKDPEPVEPWEDVRDAIFHGPNSPQADFITLTEVVGDDNCLYLNVYTKSIESDKKLPVMFWIHGGGFVHGSGDDSFHAPDYFMRKDVVLVTINYRLGALGFLNLDDEAATGNQGLKDQVLALKWVRDNIANFGGDPENVTIFGESAGAASVHYLCISRLAKGLFHKAIIQAGVALNPWAFDAKPQERAYQLCELLGHEEKDPKAAVEFLRGVEVQKLIEAQEKLRTKEERIRFNFSFGPSIDAKSRHSFLPVHPDEAAKKGVSVPLIIGHCNREGIITLIEMGKAHGRFNKECEELLHPNSVETMKKLYNLTPDNVKNIYLQDEEINDGNLEKLVDMLGDLYFVEGIHRVIKTQVEKDAAPTYLYKFSYDKEASLFKWLAKTKMTGASHVDDMAYLFPMQPFPTMKHQFASPKKSWFQTAKWSLMSIPLSYLVKYGRCAIPKEGSEKYRISEQMIEMWVNFATTGKPTAEKSELIPVDWQPVDDVKNFPCLNIREVLSTEVETNLDIEYAARGHTEVATNLDVEYAALEDSEN